MPYAQFTEVPIEKTKAEIERLVSRAGASSFLAGYDGATGRAMIAFALKGWNIRLSLNLPKSASDCAHDAAGRTRSLEGAQRAMEQEHRARWRALLLVVKAKFEGVDRGIETLEHAFLADIHLADGRTVGEHAIPELQDALKSGRLVMRPLLGAGS